MKKLLKTKYLITIALLALVSAGVFQYKKNTGKAEAARYVTAGVERSTLVVSVSGSGQVSVKNQVEIKPKASATLIAVNAINGQLLGKGAVFARLDSREQQKQIRDAKVN